MPKKKLFLVDDNLELREAIKRAIDKIFDVVSAGTAHEAIRYIQSEALIDVLVTDFDLGSDGKADGLEVAQAMRAKSPRVPIILVTGTHPDNPRIKELLSMPHTSIVGKPFTKAVLLEVLESASDPAQAARVRA
jgi:CheY-like chemotaxis protein